MAATTFFLQVYVAFLVEDIPVQFHYLLGPADERLIAQGQI